jgi:DNA polymerase-3 subunit epsilon
LTTFVAIDFETANKHRDSACQVGMVRVEGSTIVRAEARLIRPPTDFFEFTHIHGITSKMLREAGAGPFVRVWRELEGMLEGASYLVAHNAEFDKSVLEACFKLDGLRMLPLPWRCSMWAAKEAWPDLPSKKLDVVCQRLGIALKHHEALSDAKACAEVWHRSQAVIMARGNGWGGDGKGGEVDGLIDATRAPAPAPAAPTTESDRKAAFAARMAGTSSLSLSPSPSTAPQPPAAPPAPGPEVVQGYTAQQARETGFRVARGELQMPLDVIDPWVGEVLMLAQTVERQRQSFLRLFAHFGISVEEARTILRGAPKVEADESPASVARRPAVHPRCCAGCGTKSLSDQGQCTRCGWSKPSEQAA